MRGFNSRYFKRKDGRTVIRDRPKDDLYWNKKAAGIWVRRPYSRIKNYRFSGR
jgi:hypothetical protein